MKIKLLVLFIIIAFSAPVYGVSEVLLGQAGQPLYTLIITGSGTGSGTIISNIYGINCISTAGVESGTCSSIVPMGTTITLTETPVGGAEFAGWSGDASGYTTTALVLIDGNKTINAAFSGTTPPTFSFINVFVADPGTRVRGHINVNLASGVFYCGMFASGVSGSGGAQQIYQKRNILDGSLVWTRTYVGTGLGVNAYHDAFLYNGNIYAIGSYQSNGWYMVKFSEDNVNIWGAFELAGAPYSGGGAIYADSSGVYTAYYRGSIARWRVQKWTDANPPVMIWTQDLNIGAQYPFRIRNDGTNDNIIIVGGNGNARIEKRSKSDGSLLGSGGWTNGANNEIMDITDVQGGTTLFAGGYDFGGGAYRARYEKFNISNLIASNSATDTDAGGERLTTSGIDIDLMGVNIFGGQGQPAGGAAGTQLKLVKRLASDLSFVSQVNLGDFAIAGIANQPGIKYVPPDGTYLGSILIISVDFSGGGAWANWRIQRRKASDLGT